MSFDDKKSDRGELPPWIAVVGALLIAIATVFLVIKVCSTPSDPDDVAAAAAPNQAQPRRPPSWQGNSVPPADVGTSSPPANNGPAVSETPTDPSPPKAITPEQSADSEPTIELIPVPNGSGGGAQVPPTPHVFEPPRPDSNPKTDGATQGDSGTASPGNSNSSLNGNDVRGSPGAGQSARVPRRPGSPGFLLKFDQDKQSQSVPIAATPKGVDLRIAVWIKPKDDTVKPEPASKIVIATDPEPITVVFSVMLYKPGAATVRIEPWVGPVGSIKAVPGNLDRLRYLNDNLPGMIDSAQTAADNAATLAQTLQDNLANATQVYAPGIKSELDTQRAKVSTNLKLVAKYQWEQTELPDIINQLAAFSGTEVAFVIYYSADGKNVVVAHGGY